MSSWAHAKDLIQQGENSRVLSFFIPNRVVDMTELSIWGPYALRRSVYSCVIQYQHTPRWWFLKYLQNPMVGAPKRQGCATQLRHRSWYRWCIEQAIYCNSIDLRRVVRLNGSLFYSDQMSSWAQAKDLAPPFKAFWNPERHYVHKRCPEATEWPTLANTTLFRATICDQKATTFRVVANRSVAFGEPWLHSLQNAKASFAFHSFAQAFNHILRHLTQDGALFSEQWGLSELQSISIRIIICIAFLHC